jgi:hypothetical protein
LPSTFPEWWGHQEFQPPKKVGTPVEKELPVEKKLPAVEPPSPPVKKEEPVNDAVGPAWISCKVTPIIYFLVLISSNRGRSNKEQHASNGKS